MDRETYIRDSWDCLTKAFITVKPLAAALWSGFFWLITPREAYIPAAGFVIAAVILDLLTRWWAIAYKAGGWMAAWKDGSLNSKGMQRGVSKFAAYLAVMLLAAQVTRAFAPVSALAAFIGEAAVTYALAFLSIREIRSIVENIVDAGHDGLRPLLSWAIRKQEQVEKKMEE